MRYSEAYCRLPIAALDRAFDANRGELIWRDEDGAVVGTAKVMSRSGGIMRVAFDIDSACDAPRFTGEIGVDIIRLDAGMHRKEAYAICPSCNGRVKHLIARQASWKCRTCHGLVNRKSLLRDNIRLTEKLASLEDEVRKGRPKGMHNSTFQKKVDELDACRKRLGSNALHADSRFRHFITHKLPGGSIKIIDIDQVSSNRQRKIFQNSLYNWLEDRYKKLADDVLRRSALRGRVLNASDLRTQVVDATEVQPLILGLSDELVSGASSEQQRTIIEVPYFGDPALFDVRAEAGKDLPLCLAQIDEEAGVVRFTFDGSANDNPALRVRIDDQQSVLHRQVEYLAEAINRYHAYAERDAENFIQRFIANRKR